jgi:uncharacterized membrane protein YgdD (TMEM256/DUF423 family)
MWWQIHSISGALAVALGAFGAHGLKTRVKDVKLLEVWDTAVKYHLVHSLIGLLATLPTHPILISMLKQHGPHAPIARYANYFAFVGNVLFSGSLYGIVLTDVKKLGIITPFGGLCYIAAWICLAKGW